MDKRLRCRICTHIFQKKFNIIDISHKSDIEKIVKAFYLKAPQDKLIGKYFTEVVHLDLNIHLPKIVDFWASVLLGDMGYKGNPMLTHIQLSRKEQLLQKHFDRWNYLWVETIDEMYQGVVANLAKEKAVQISRLMLYKIEGDGRLLI